MKSGSAMARRPVTSTAERHPNKERDRLRWKSWHLSSLYCCSCALRGQDQCFYIATSCIPILLNIWPWHEHEWTCSLRMAEMLNPLGMEGLCLTHLVTYFTLVMGNHRQPSNNTPDSTYQGVFWPRSDITQPSRPFIHPCSNTLWTSWTRATVRT